MQSWSSEGKRFSDALQVSPIIAIDAVAVAIARLPRLQARGDERDDDRYISFRKPRLVGIFFFAGHLILVLVSAEQPEGTPMTKVYGKSCKRH